MRRLRNTAVAAGLLVALGLQPVSASTSSDPRAPEPAGTFPGANGLIAFQGHDGSDNEIYSVSSSGGPPTQLTFNSANDGAPRYSPDGSKIAFISDDQVWKMGATGTNLMQVTTGPRPYKNVDWAPDGRRLIAEGNGVQGNDDLFVMKANGDDLKNITKTRPDEGNPAWSPTGRFIAYERPYQGSSQIWRMTSAGTRVRRLTDLPSSTYLGTWHPDGSKLLIVHAPGGAGDYEIARISKSGGGYLQITDNGYNDEAPTYSPDGLSMLWSDDFDGDYELVQDEIPALSSITQITFDSVNEFESDWQPV